MMPLAPLPRCRAAEVPADLAEVERTVSRLERRIKERFPAVSNVFVEVQASEHHRRAAEPAAMATGEE